MFNIQKSILGIDFTSNAINIVELFFNDSNHSCLEKFTSFATIDLMQKSVLKIADSSFKSIKKSIKQQGFHSSKAIIGVPEEDAIIKIVRINRQDIEKREQLLEELILENVYERISQPISNINYDFVVLDQFIIQQNIDLLKKIISDNNLIHEFIYENHLYFLFVGVKKDYLDKRLEILSRCDLEVIIVDLELLASIRAQKYLAGIIDNKKILQKYLTAFGLALGAL